MQITLFGRLKNIFFKSSDMPPAQAYNLWASAYDQQPDNLMLAMDEELVSTLLKEMELGKKTILDIGCGTGRHWQKLLRKHPQQLVGYDVSEGMLKMLVNKFPEAIAYQSKNNRLMYTKDNSVDLVISTLTIAHIENAGKALTEWDRVLKAGGEVLLTDYHPQILRSGGKRTFKVDNKTVSVKNYVHAVEELVAIANKLGWKKIYFEERKIEEGVKHFYEKQNALNVYESFKGMPVIYAIHFRKET